MHVDVPHKLNQTDAVSRVKLLCERLRREYIKHISSLKEEWHENFADVKIRAMGMTFTGNIQITPNVVIVKLNIPFAAAFFRKQIKEQITKNLKNILA